MQCKRIHAMATDDDKFMVTQYIVRKLIFCELHWFLQCIRKVRHIKIPNVIHPV